MTVALHEWLEAARTFRDDEDASADATPPLHAQLLMLPEDSALDVGLASLWKAARPIARSRRLGVLLQRTRVGRALGHALLTTVEDADDASANAALQVLATAESEVLDAEAWRRLGRVARKERKKTLPDKEVTVLLAQLGPAEAVASLALAAFRRGPEDAEDRLAATTGLGRSLDARAPEWVRRLIGSGASRLECVHAVAQALAIGQEPAPWVPVLLHAAGAGATGTPAEADVAGIDAWVRWAAIDGLCHVESDEGLPLLLAAWQASGEDLPPWYLTFCEQRAAALAPTERKPTLARLAAKIPHLPQLHPLVGLAGRVQSRCPRIARRAMVEWVELHGEGTPLERARARVETALVARGQLLGTFLADDGSPAVELDATWAPNCLALADTERDALLAEEAAWLGG